MRKKIDDIKDNVINNENNNSSNSNNKNVIVSAEKIELYSSNIVMSVRDKKNVFYNILPKNATDKSVSFISANNEIVSIDNNAHDVVRTLDLNRSDL